MSKEPPANQIENPGRKPSWEEGRMEAAIDRYFEIYNFNQAAREYDVPVSTLFYKVKTDPRYGKEEKEVESGDKAEKEGQVSLFESSSTQETAITPEQVVKAAILGAAAFGGFKAASDLWNEFSGSQNSVETSGTDRERLQSTSAFYRKLVGNLRKITGLTDPFAEGIGSFQVAAAIADTLGISTEKIDEDLLRDIAKDWRDPGPLEKTIRVGDYRTVPPPEVPPDRKERLEEFAARKDQLIKAYLKDEKDGWAILTSSGKIIRYLPTGPDSFEEWGKALGWGS